MKNKITTNVSASPESFAKSMEQFEKLWKEQIDLRAKPDVYLVGKNPFDGGVWSDGVNEQINVGDVPCQYCGAKLDYITSVSHTLRCEENYNKDLEDKAHAHNLKLYLERIFEK